MANVTKKKVAKPTAKIVKKAAAKTAAKSAPTKTAKTGSSNGAVKKVTKAVAQGIRDNVVGTMNNVKYPYEFAQKAYEFDGKVANAAKKVKDKATATLTQARGVSSTKKVARGNMVVPKHDPYSHLNSKRGAAKKGETQYEKDKRLFGTPFADYAKANPSEAKKDRFYNAQTTVIMDTARRNQARKKDADIAKREKLNGNKRVKK